MSDARPLVLLVDDNRDFLDAMISLLETTENYRILQAGNGNEALAQLANEVPDLMITDISMPAMNGFELIEQVRKDARLDSLRIVLLTANNASEQIRRGRELGVTDYIIKPFIPGEFLDKLAKLLEGA
jgi:CheY-like chemotaxis protein